MTRCGSSPQTLTSLEGCMQRTALWNRLAHFQRIADAHPGSQGHPNRNTGTQGYKASVDYVAGLMRRAGYAVTIQSYNWRQQRGQDSPRFRLARQSVPADAESIDYNVIADSPYGDPKHVVTIEGHLDAIFGAGMLDNASGSTTILEIALAMAKTPTHNRLRFIWFGGEELGLLGSQYYTEHLTRAQLHRIVFDVDADVTATPNFDILVADPAFAKKAKKFPPNVIPGSKLGNDLFYQFFQGRGVASKAAGFGNDGTDSLSFSFAGIPDTGILTQQDCCKHRWEVQLWGGYLGNYEGTVPGHNGGCVDWPHRWCDNLSNNDPSVLELVSKAVAFVTFQLANHRFAR